jgi:hypothetical protein
MTEYEKKRWKQFQLVHSTLKGMSSGAIYDVGYNDGYFDCADQKRIFRKQVRNTGKDKRIKELEELLYEASVYCPYELVEKIDSALLEESIYEQSGPWDGGHEEFPVDDSGKDQ